MLPYIPTLYVPNFTLYLVLDFHKIVLVFYCLQIKAHLYKIPVINNSNIFMYQNCLIFVVGDTFLGTKTFAIDIEQSFS